MKPREVGNLFLHLGLGLGLTAAVLWFPPAIIPVTFIYAWLREQAQHRYIFTAPPDSITVMVHKRTFFDFGWVTWHRIWEVLQWTIGSAVAYGVWYFFG